jgi:hypothetical protein
MTHLAEEDMVMHYYGEADDVRLAGAHLAECEECRRAFDELSTTLQAMTATEVPERGDSYGARVWARIQPRIAAEQERRGWWRSLPAMLTSPKLAAAGAVAVLLAAAYVAGRSSVPPPQPEAQRAAVPSDAARERVLLGAVGSHLDRSRVVLTEIAHRDGDGTADISPERATAVDLAADNRLYRQAAARNGDAAVASVLEDLERVLVEIASSPSPASHDDLARWREQIQTKGLLFKVTVMSLRVRERQQDAAAASRPASKSST